MPSSSIFVKKIQFVRWNYHDYLSVSGYVRQSSYMLNANINILVNIIIAHVRRNVK